VVKANIGGSGAGHRPLRQYGRAARCDCRGRVAVSVDGVLLVQDYVPARGGAITRIETLDRAYLYAIDVSGGGAFDLCPADACVTGSGASAMTAVQPAPRTASTRPRRSRARPISMSAGSK
jgi:hypothetical protein